MARGEFDMKVPMLTHDEIGELAMAFNRMGLTEKFHYCVESGKGTAVWNSQLDGRWRYYV